MIEKETPFTAETVASRLTNLTERFSTSTSGLVAVAATAVADGAMETEVVALWLMIISSGCGR
jgi:hypothetical protein